MAIDIGRFRIMAVKMGQRFKTQMQKGERVKGGTPGRTSFLLGVVILCLLLLSLPSRAGTFTDPVRGFAFDWPESWSFRPFPFLAGGAFMPIQYASDPNRFGLETIFVELDEDCPRVPS